MNPLTASDDDMASSQRDERPVVICLNFCSRMFSQGLVSGIKLMFHLVLSFTCIWVVLDDRRLSKNIQFFME
jgi:hypothetical protein